MSSRRLVNSPINPHSRTPKYLQLKAVLMRDIRSGRRREGAKLPSEQELGATLGVSKMTVRQAIAELVREGFLRRDRGKGTFVTRPRALRRFWNVISFTEEMRSRGLEVQNTLLSSGRIRPPAAIRDALGLPAGERVLRVRRLRAVYAHPIAYNVSYVPLSRCPDLDRLDLEEDSLYTIIQDHYGYQFTRSVRSFRAATAGAAEARLLRIPLGAPVLVVEGTTFVDDDVPIDYCHEVYCE